MRLVIIALFGWLLASAAQAQEAACPPLPGADALWAKPRTRFIVFGEYHGTAEIPALFGDAVCLASARRPVVVALEMPANRQAAFDAYMASDGSASAREALTTSEIWPIGQDGRSSQAMLDLIERVRALKASGRPVRLVGFIGSTGGPPHFTQNYHELGMAAALAQAAYTDHRALIMALVGNVHSRKIAITGEFSLNPAAMHLPPEDTITLNYAPIGGRAWNCRRELGCGANPFSGSDRSPRGIVLHGELRNGHDGTYSPGRSYTASSPVKPRQAP